MATTLQGEISNLPAVPDSLRVTGMSQEAVNKHGAFRDEIERVLPNIMAVVPKGVRAEAITQFVLSAALDNTALLDCSPMSVIRSTLKMATLGLQPGMTCDLVPILGQCEFWIRVKGKVQLAIEAGAITWAEVGTACVGDIFEHERTDAGTKFRFKSNVVEKIDGSNATHYWAIITLPGGEQKYESWTKEQLLEHKRVYVKGDTKPGSAWRTSFNRMAEKCVLNAAMRYANLSPKQRLAMRGDDEVQGSIEVLHTKGALENAGNIDDAFAKLGAGETPKPESDPFDTNEFALANDDEHDALNHQINGKRMADMTPRELRALEKISQVPERAHVRKKIALVFEYLDRVQEAKELDNAER